MAEGQENLALALAQLIEQRKQTEAMLARFQAFIDSANSQADVSNLKARLSRAQSLLSEFESIQIQIELMDETESTSNARETFETKYFAAIASAQEIIEEYVTSRASHAENSNSVSSENKKPQVRLPKIELPVFTGAYEQWTTFFDTFQSLIHNNDSISDIQKFHYLKSALRGDAAQVIESLQISANNYSIAWNLLTDRFQNRRLIIQNHIKALFQLTPIRGESHTSLRQLTNEVQTNLRALKALNQPTDKWDLLIIHLIQTKLEFSTKREWERSITGSELPTLESMLKFLSQKCQVLEALGSSKPVANTNRIQTTRHTITHATSIISCQICKENHYIFQCKDFLKLSVNRRMLLVKDKHLCVNCLKPNHMARNCKSSHCKKCNNYHNTLLHYDKESNSVDNDEPKNSIAGLSVDHNQEQKTLSQVMLATASVIIFDEHNKPHQCRAFLDNGSQSNFICKGLADKLGLRQNRSYTSISLVGNSKCIAAYETSCKIKSRYNDFSINLNCLVIPKITQNFPVVSMDKTKMEIPNSIKLADPYFYKWGEIELLIGAEHFYKLLSIGQITPKERNQLTWHKTQLGWIPSGRIEIHEHQNSTICSLTMTQLDEKLNRFWKLEQVEQGKLLSNEESYCEELFKNTSMRNKEGRFIVNLPIKPNAMKLGQSRDMAEKRLCSLEKRFVTNPSLKEAYISFIQEYQDLGHMERISKQCEDEENNFYLPHHAVLKEDSITTKLRVVFDGSAKSSNGLSLNDICLTGPTVQQDLTSILARFRTHKYVIVADIAKMYRQVLVNEDQTALQRILWRNNSEEEISTFELKTLTYGTVPASYLATRCLLQLSREANDKYPIGAEVIAKDFYVDDLLTGANTVEDARQIQVQASNILKQGGFELKKWISNERSILNKIEERHLPNMILNLDKNANIKTLGIQWNPATDNFQYTSSQQIQYKGITKRSILSNIAQIYDPLGLINPIIVTAKILLQELWQCKIGWDESVPVRIHTAWKAYLQDLIHLREMKIARHVITFPDASSLELHGFADASERAYGACIYIRSGNDAMGYHTNLLIAKSRVAPLKATTIPRLELCAAVLLAELMQFMIETLEIKPTKLYYWTDSSIVLAWIARPSRDYKVFVANRIARIQEITDASNWHHIGTDSNPADLVSRGARVKELIHNNLWWHGPCYLEKADKYWPNIILRLKGEINSSELKTRHLIASNSMNDELQFIFTKFSNFKRLLRITAYCFRFINNSKPGATKQTGVLLLREIEYARTMLIRIIQEQHFRAEIHDLKNGKYIAKSSSILRLDPFLDNDKILRVGGRLKLSNTLCYDAKHPILLPGGHPVIESIVRHFHNINLHAGVQGTLAAIRNTYWITRAKPITQKIVRNCIICFRNRPADMKQFMGELPNSRIEPSRPFTNTGIDYCGPFIIKDMSPRSKKKMKSYAALFVCMATKAVHLELVEDLTTESFLAALKRFIARRGMISHIYSDNATNFVGANRELQKLRDVFTTENEVFNNAITDQGITWHFIPSRSPHFGGLWESAVKAAKHHLKRIAANAVLNYVEFYTLLTQIEYILNSRPLTPISDDPNDYTFLTPNHFLIGDSGAAIPEPNLQDISAPRLSRWQHIEKIKQHFWTRWSKEYLGQLHQRTKWSSREVTNIKVGQLVLIKEENIPSNRWTTGRIEEVHPGADKIVRAVTLRLPHGSTTTRATSKIVQFPVDNSV